MQSPDDLPVPFRCDVLPERNQVRVAPVGELDAATVDELAGEIAELRHSGFKRLVLDLRELTFIDSSGLRLVLGLDAASGADFELIMIPGPPAVQRIFELTSTLELLPFVNRSRQ